MLNSSILAANKSLRIFSIAKMAAKRSQHAMLNGQYQVFKWNNCHVLDTSVTFQLTVECSPLLPAKAATRFLLIYYRDFSVSKFWFATILEYLRSNYQLCFGSVPLNN